MRFPPLAFHFPNRKSLFLLAATIAFTVRASLCWAAEVPAPENDTVAGELVIATFFGVIVLGVILGLTGRAVVFRNYDDLALVFGCGVTMVLAVMIGPARVLLLLDLLACAGLCFVIVGRTWRDNGLLLLPVILVTKVILSVLWIKYVIEAVNPSGKTMLDRSRNRGGAMLVLVILTPLMARLVRDHEGFLTRRTQVHAYK